MRTIIFTFSFLVLLINLLKGQEYDPIIDNTKVWSTLSGGYGLFAVECCYQTSFIKFSDDTIIENNICKKVIRSADSLKTFYTIGFIREINKRIYFTNLKYETGLIYDFNIRPGDTAKVVIDNYSLGAIHDTVFYNSTFIVTKVDTFEYASKKRLRLTLNDIDHHTKEQWIEGIGSISGILSSGYASTGWAGGFWELLCVSQLNNLIYFNTERKSCYLVDKTGIPNIGNSNYFTVYPNPAKKMITITGLQITNGANFIIFDLSGEVIFNSIINSNIISLPNLKSNIYFYRIVTINNEINGKLIIK